MLSDVWSWTAGMEKGRIRSPSSLMARPCAQTSCSRWEHAHTAWQSRCCLQQLPFYSLFHMVCLPPCVDSRILHKSQLLPSSLFHTCLFSHLSSNRMLFKPSRRQHLSHQNTLLFCPLKTIAGMYNQKWTHNDFAIFFFKYIHVIDAFFICVYHQ